MKTHTIDFTDIELQVILKALKVSKYYFEDDTRTEEQASIETSLINDLQDDYKITPYTHSI